MVKHEFIRPSESPYGSPMLFVRKRDGNLQFYIDYNWLNKQTIQIQYPLLLLEEMLEYLGGANVFRKWV